MIVFINILETLYQPYGQSGQTPTGYGRLLFIKENYEDVLIIAQMFQYTRGLNRNILFY